MENKKGISLIMLVITIVILAILVAVSISGTVLATNNAKRVSFAEELNNLEENVSVAFSTGSEYPVEGSIYTYQMLVSNGITVNQATMVSELNKNGEVIDPDGDQSLFSIIDMKKIGVTSTNKGTRKDGNTSDIFILSNKTSKIYYVKGEKIGNKKYHSLTSELSDITNIKSNSNSSNDYLSINTKHGVIISKNTDKYVSTLTLKIETVNRDLPQYRYEMVIGSNKKDILLVDGQYKIVPGKDFTKEQILSNSFAIINKIDVSTGLPIGSGSINISNIDLTPPVLNSNNVKIIKSGENTLVEIVASDSQSGIDKYYIDYIYKLKDGALYKPVENYIKNYYSQTVGVGSEEQIKKYMKDFAKSSDTNKFKLDEEDYMFRVIVIDKAGNISNYVTQKYRPYIPEGFYYVGGEIDTGLIISDNINDSNKGESYEVSKTLQGNQFVWIPVNNLSQLERKTVFPIYSEWPTIDFNSFTESMPDEDKLKIIDKGGFYISRYEASSQNPNGIFSKYGQTPIGDCPFLTAYDYARAYYPTKSNIKVNLPYGEMWDRILTFIEENGTNIYTDSSLGNFNTGRKYTSGYSSQYNTKNIYDLAGNIMEWTIEGGATGGYRDYRSLRGGSFNVSFSTLDMVKRYCNNVYSSSVTSSAVNVAAYGFRVAFYEK